MSMTFDKLKSKISATINKSKVIQLIEILKKEPFAIRDLIDLSFNEDKHIAYRAAWILENLFLKYRDYYVSDVKYLMSRFIDVRQESCQRHYVKIFMQITRPDTPEVIRLELESINLEANVEKCFDLLIDPKVKIAVKLFACNALFHLRHQYAVIEEELENQIKFLMMHNTSPGIIAGGNKLLIKLKQN